MSTLNIFFLKNFESLAPHRLEFQVINTVYMCSLQNRFCGINSHLLYLGNLITLKFQIDKK